MQTDNEREDERMDIIARNGNEGLHYEMSRIETLRYRHEMIDEVEEEKEEPECPA